MPLLLISNYVISEKTNSVLRNSATALSRPPFPKLKVPYSTAPLNGVNLTAQLTVTEDQLRRPHQ
jgi:hypothetical protein